MSFFRESLTKLALSIWLFTCALSGVDVRAQFRFDSWTTDNGLPQTSINSILQTRDGFLWLTTFGGLVRYDGLRFQVFNTGNTKGLTTSRFLQLFEDGEGTLWITTESQGVTRYRDGNFSTYTAAHGVPNGLLRFDQDKFGNLLLNCSPGDENFELRWTGENFVPYLSPDGSPVRNILRRTPTGIWFLAENRLRKFADGRVSIDFAPGFKIRRVFEDKAGRLWIVSTEGVLYSYTDGQLTDYSKRKDYPPVRFNGISEDNRGRIWIGAQGGLALYEKDKFALYTVADGLVGSDVDYAYHDREGTVWAASKAGLSRLTQRAVKAYSVEDGLAADNVYPIYQDRKGKIWIGSWTGLTVYENGRFESVGERYNLAKARVMSFLEDSRGNFWIGSWDEGLRLVKNGTIISYSPVELSANQVRTIAEDRADNIWFGTGGGLVKFKDERFTKYTNQDGLSGKVVYAVYEDRSGQLWVGTDSGLSVYKNGVFTLFTQANSGIAVAPFGIVRSIYEDSSGVLWVGMYDSGLYRYKDGRFTHYTTNEGLFDNGAFQIIEDDAANFWISCNLGIYRVRKSELNDFADERIEKITSIPYNKRDGMLNSECNGGASPAGIRAGDGSIWFPTQKGVAVIDPDSVPFNIQPPPVVIESLLVDTRPFDLRQPIKIEPEQTNLEINYAGLSYINPELVKFKYKLEGLDDGWIDASTRRTAFYSHLPAGKYTFKVTAANRDGVWNEAGTTMEITVLPPFYRTWWFTVLTILMVTGFVFAVYRWRVGALERARASQEAFSQKLLESQEAERKRIAGGLHDNLGQHLIIIKNWAALALSSTAAGDPIREQLNEISSTSLQALNEVRETIYDLRPYQLEAIGLTNTIKFMVEHVAASSGINFATDCDDIDNVFSPEDEVTFYRTIQECVSNIVKHSRAENAAVTIKRDGENIRVEISDDGKGFVPETRSTPNKHGGFGLTGLSERVKMLGGTHEIQTASGQGTTVSIYIRARR